MTALETLVANSLDLTTLISELYCTSTCLDSVDDDYKTTTMACSITTALNNIQVPDNIVIIRNAQSYVDSLSTEQLVELDQLLAEKELDFDIEEKQNITIEQPKQYTKIDTKQHK